MAHPYHAHREHKANKHRVKHVLGHKRGGAAHSDAAEDRAMIRTAVHKHEAHMHGGKSKTRLDKFARGGKTKGKHHTQVNVIVAPHRGPPSAAGAPAGAGPVPPPSLPGGPPKPPMGMPPGGPMPPPGGPPGMGPMKRGGRAYKRGGGIGMTAGADSGEGRLQKAHKYKKH